MKLISSNQKRFAWACVFGATVLFTGCGKDNPSPEPTPSVPQPGKGSIEMAVGTFKGQMTVFRAEGGDEDYYDAVVVVTKVGAEQLKAEAKSGEAYSDASPK